MKIAYQSLLCLAAAAAPLLAQDNIIRTESRVVLVDAVVTDKKGHYVRDLKQSAFRVWEDNKEQTITSFTFESDAKSPANDRKHYLVLFFDNSTSSPQDQFAARAAAIRFIDANAAKNRLMAVVEYSGSLRVTQNFTDDADRLKKVVNGVKFSALSPNSGPPVLRSFAALNVLVALRDLAKGMAAVPGRKTLVFISGGFRLNQDTYAELDSTIRACNQSNVAVYPIDVRGLMSTTTAAPNGATLRLPQAGILQPAAFQGRRGAPRTPPNMEPMGGGRGGNASPMNNQMVLSALASGTGGFMIANTNDVLAGLEKIGSEQNEFYLLGYTPSKDLEPGVCHNIRVKVDAGAQVRFRTSYCDVKPKDILAGTPTERDLENRVKANAASTVKATMLAPFVYLPSGAARVDVVLNFPTEALAFTKEKGKLHMALNVIGLVHLPDGAVAARFSDTIKRDFEDKKQADAFQQTPFHYEKQFEVAAGKYTLDVAFSSGPESFGKLAAPLNVEAYEPTQFQMSALVLSKNAHPANGTGSFLDDLVPFVAAGVELTPSGTDHFSKTEHGYVYAELYEPAYLTELKDPIGVGVDMQIVDLKTARIVLDSGLVRLENKPEPGLAVVPFALKLDFTNMAPGSYRIYMASGDSAGHKYNRTINFDLAQ